MRIAGLLLWAATTPEERALLATALDHARASIAAALGPPRVGAAHAIFCKTEACALAYAGTSRRSRALMPGIRAPGATFTASRPTIVVLRVDRGALAVTMHEIVHLEVHVRARDAAMPAWFDDGVAASLSNAPDCHDVSVRGVDDLRRLDGSEAWEQYTAVRNALVPAYCQARAEVAAWIERHGRDALPALLDRLGAGEPFDHAYGPLVQPATRDTPVMSLSTELGQPHGAFTLALWIAPHARTGVLAHVSDTVIGAGACTELLGFAADGTLVAQVLTGNTPTSFASAVARNVPVGRWSHVAMTWAVSGGLSLYIDGTLAAHTDAPAAIPTAAWTYVTWGSPNLAGESCWHGHVAAARFDGAIASQILLPHALGADEIAALARALPEHGGATDGSR
jgi:hypothetical protein